MTGPIDGNFMKPNVNLFRVTTERADDALPVMNYSAPVLSFKSKQVNQNFGLSQRGSALAQVSAFAAGLPVQSAETTQRVSADCCRYLDVYPYA